MKALAMVEVWRLRIIFFSIGAISAFHLLKLALPYSVNLLRSVLPGLWLYIGLNFIILTIAGTSIFHPSPPAKTHKTIEPNKKLDQEAHDQQLLVFSPAHEAAFSPENYSNVSCLEKMATNHIPIQLNNEVDQEVLGKCSNISCLEKTQATTTVEVAAGKKELSMEVMWRDVLKKSVTFDETRRRREAWMSQEELHSRSEAFIRSFNERLRLQRQESDERYRAMVNQSTMFASLI